MLWSDPQPGLGRAPSKRGVGVAFGADVTKNFLQRNNLQLVVRSHEVKEEGFMVEHDGCCITIFSAPNYCDTMGNKGAFIRFESDMVPHFTSFDAVVRVPCCASCVVCLTRTLRAAPPGRAPNALREPDAAVYVNALGSESLSVSPSLRGCARSSAGPRLHRLRTGGCCFHAKLLGLRLVERVQELGQRQVVRAAVRVACAEDLLQLLRATSLMRTASADAARSTAARTESNSWRP